MLESEMKWRKEAMQIQPKDCQCLPELTKHMLIWAIEDRVKHTTSDLQSRKETASKYPELFAAVGSKRFEFSAEVIEEIEIEIASFEFLLDQIKSMRNCDEFHDLYKKKG